MTAINGTWQVVSSIGINEYFQIWVPDQKSDFAYFEKGSKSFHFDQETLMLTETTSLGTVNQCSTICKLGEKVTASTKKFYMFVKNNALVRVALRNDGEEFMRFKMFVKNGQLHIVVKRFGLSCTRTYEKIELEARGKKIVSLASERRMQVKHDLEEKSKEVSTLKTELKEQRATVANAANTPEFDEFLGHWQLKNDNKIPQFVPKNMLFSYEDDKFVERNNGGLHNMYVCASEKSAYNWDFARGVRTYFDRRTEELITEAIFATGELEYCMKKSVEKNILLMKLILPQEKAHGQDELTKETVRYEIVYTKIVI